MGNSPLTSGCIPVAGSRGTRTDVDVRDSTPTTTASPVTKPRIRLPKVRRPARRLSAMKRGIHPSSRDGVIPGI